MATIQGVYLALFGRPADPAGLSYFNSVTKNGADLSGIGNLAGQKEYLDRFTGMNNAQIINTIYQSLFNRDAEAAGLEFFAAALNIGKLTINNIAIAILDGAQGDDKVSANKVAAADLYTKGLETAVEIASYVGNAAADQARAFIKSITAAAVQSAVDDAVKAMVGKGAAGVSVKLTDAAAGDSFTAAKGITMDGKEVLATDRDDTITATGATWTAADTIDAGLGRDTLVLTEAVGATVAKDKLKNVEVLDVTTTAGASIDVAEAKELVEIVNVASAENLSVSNIGLKATVGLKGAIAAGKTTSFAFAKAKDGSSDAIALKLDGATATGAVTIADVETVNIANSGTSRVDALTIAAAKAVGITGSGDLTLGVTASTTLETLNAADFDGKLTINTAALSGLKTINGGRATDKIAIGAQHSNDLTVNGGAGADTLSVNVAAADSAKQKTYDDAVAATKTVEKVVADKVAADAAYKASDDETKAIADAKTAEAAAKAALGAVSITKALTLTGGADADIFIFNGKIGNVVDVSTNDNFVKTLITITDFDKSADAIKFMYGDKEARDVLLSAEQAEITGAQDLLAAAKVAASYTTKDKFSVFTYGGDAYMLGQDGNADLSAGDTLVKITGLASVSDLSAANFQIA